MSNKDSKNQEARSKKEENEGGILSRLGEIPIVNSAISVASTSYSKVKDANPVAKLGLSLAELSIKAAVNTTKFAYKVIPKPEFVYDVEKKVVRQADVAACKGLDALQSTFPYVMTETEQIISSGIETLEKSEVLEAALIVSEAAIDYIQPMKQTSQNGAHRAKSSTASVRKVDRMIDVSTKTGSILYEGGSKMFWNAASVPWKVTKAGYNMMAGAAAYVPGLSIFIPSHRKLRRSTRRRTKVKPENVLSFPFPSSPERKRKRSTADSESETGELFELVYIDKPYDSDDDPDYDPADDPNRGEGSGSDSSGTVEASEDDDDDNNDNDDDDDVDDDDDDDSGEGDENDSSPVGGKTLKPEEVKKKSPKSDSVALKGIGAGQSATLIVHVKDNKETIEKIKRASTTDEEDSVDSRNMSAPTTTEFINGVEVPQEKERSPVIVKSHRQYHRRCSKEGDSKNENTASDTVLNGAKSAVHNGVKSTVVGAASSAAAVNAGASASSKVVSGTNSAPANGATRSAKSPSSNASSFRRNYSR